MKKFYLRKISLNLAILFLLVNTYTVTARAATPVIAVQNTTSLGFTASEEGTINVADSAVKRIVSNLRVTNLEAPKAGQKLDLYATVLSDDGSYWQIPVVWVDDTGNVSYICLPGKNYRPVFAYFVPKNVVIANDLGSNSYSIKLPEFLDGIIDASNVLMVSSQAYGITFITTGDIANLISTSADGTGNGPRQMLSAIVSNSQIRSFFASPDNSNIKDFNAYIEALKKSQEAQTADNASQNSTNSDGQTKRPVDPSGKSGDSGDKSEEGGGSGGGGDIPTPVEKDYVKLHCSEKAITALGHDNLQKLCDLIINIIEPQAIYQLSKGFSAYASAEKENLIGKEIGLYIYDSNVDDTKGLPEGSCAYVSATYLDNDNKTFGYYIGVDAKTLYTEDSDGNYALNEDELESLNNTIIHELMHAYMFDYTRTGMVGIVLEDSEYKPDDNEFPEWFSEGIASAVDNIYTTDAELFDEMMVDLDESEESDDESEADDSTETKRYTKESLLEYYTHYYSDSAGGASIDTTNKYYSKDNNLASAYVSGYLAVMYLGALANDYMNEELENSDSAIELVVENDDGYYYNSEAIRNGLNYILEELHSGKPLDAVISTISDGKYAETADFQDAFLSVDDEGNYDESFDFCVGVLNYLDYATQEFQKDDSNARANGSILLAFDTEAKSPIEDKLPDDIGAQQVFVINDSKTYVTSTVDNDTALASAGVKETAITDGDSDEEASSGDTENINLSDEAAAAAKVVAEAGEEAVASNEALESENTEVCETEDAEAKDAEPKSAEKDGTEKVDSEKENSEIKNDDKENSETESTLKEDSEPESTESASSEKENSENKNSDKEISETKSEKAETSENEAGIKSEEETSEPAEEGTTKTTEEVENKKADVVLLPSLIDTNSDKEQKIEAPGTTGTNLEVLEEAVALPASSENSEDSDEDNDDDGNDVDSGDE